jgi:hypothetical protein
MSREDFRIFDATSGHVVACMYHCEPSGEGGGCFGWVPARVQPL